jgi:hypothetical protein
MSTTVPATNFVKNQVLSKIIESFEGSAFGECWQDGAPRHSRRLHAEVDARKRRTVLSGPKIWARRRKTTS